VEYINVMVY